MASHEYEIRIEGYLGSSLANFFPGLSINPLPDGCTVLRGLLDHSALHGVLRCIGDLGIALLAVNRIGTDSTQS